MSQIATTIKQSKRLLDAGLDPMSADMRWETFSGCVPHLCYQHDATPLIAPKVTPAWSLSKLWDMLGLDILGGWFSIGSHRSEDVIEELVSMLENRHANH